MEKGLTMAAGQVCGITVREFPARVFKACDTCDACDTREVHSDARGRSHLYNAVYCIFLGRHSVTLRYKARACLEDS